MRVPPQFIDEVIGRTDIVSLVREYVELKQKGRNYWGNCPFHLEKTPSFSVSPEKNMFYCFGCQKGGGPAQFLMELENLHYLEAIEKLAERVGLKMPVSSAADQQKQEKQEKLLELNKKAALFYCKMLTAPCGEEAREYLNQRGMNRETQVRFGIGFAPPSWDALLKHMAQLQIDREELVEAGLVRRNEKGKVYDTFRNRVIFPIINVGGKVIGFGGRQMEDGGPKYINSPDTSVFDKSRNLYGLNFSKKSKSDTAILTEGYMDTIALHQAGFDYAVGSLGTAFTEGHSQLLSRYFKKVVLAFDSDGAGVSATSRAIPLLEKAGLSVRVLQMDGAKDPDEYIKKKGKGSFANLIQRSEHHLDYRLAQMKKKYKLEDTAQRVEFLQEVAKYLATVESPVEREIYGAKAAEFMGISLEGLTLEVNKEVQARSQYLMKREMRQNLQEKPMSRVQPHVYENVRLAKAEEGLLRVLMLEPSFLQGMSEFTSKDFKEPLLARLFQVIKERYFQGFSVELCYLGEYFSPPELNYLVNVMNQPQDLSSLMKAKEDYLSIMEEEDMKSQHTGDDALMAIQQQLQERKDP